MECVRWEQWSNGDAKYYYNQLSSATILKITNNEGQDRRLVSISIKLATGRGSVTSSGGGTITGYGYPYNVYLSNGSVTSDTHTISKEANNVGYYSGGAYFKLAQMTDDYYVKFNFYDKPVIPNGASWIFSYYKSNVSTLLVCPPTPYSGHPVGSSNGVSYIYCETESLYDPPYNFENSLSISPDIGVYKVTNYTFNYNINKGSNDLAWVHMDVYDDGTSNLIDWKNVNTNFGYRSDTMQIGVNNYDNGYSGGKFQGQIIIHDGINRFTTNKVDLYTYTYPTLSLSSTTGPFSPQDSKKFNWTANVARWKGINKELDFTTTLKINGVTVNNVSQLPTYNTNTNPPEIDLKDYLSSVYYDNNARSVAQMIGTITVERENTSAYERNNYNRYYVSQSANYIVQYQPTQAPINGTAEYSGQMIVIQDVETIKATWGYNSLVGAAGVVSGYDVEIYADSNLTEKVGNTITVSAGSVTIDTKNQLKRGVLNYAKITPFYTKPNGTGNILGLQYTVITLVKPISRLNAPQIDYPINNTTWLNKNFRILLQLPEDDDLSVLIADGTIIDQTAYRYEDIKVEIIYNNVTKTYTWKDNREYFSTDTLSYKKKIAIHPGADITLGNANVYTINVYVQKKYYQTSEISSWSKASSISVKNSSISEFTFIAGVTNISINQYNTIRDKSIEMNAVYPFKVIDNRNIVKNSGDFINYSEYAGIYQTVLDIQDGVNSYCDYTDYPNVAFNADIDNLKDDVPKTEIITAAKEDSILGGRNYINLIIEDMNKLK